MSELPEYIRYLLKRGSYEHPAPAPELVQTHISYVILAGDYVYKWKKPVDFGFIDFSTLARRKLFCEEELRLNRRLCPDIYLDVVKLTRNGDFSLSRDEGEVCEYGVKMVRMPREMMMGRVIERGELTEHHIEAIVDRLVPFYQDAALCEIDSVEDSIGLVRKNIFDNFRLTEQFVGCPALSRERFDRIRAAAERFLNRRELFASRLASGSLRDCHGDLHSANICLPDEVYIFDCIEFNPGLRCGDVAADIAFLAMDLDFHGLESLSELFVKLYVERSGDRGLVNMLRFYQCYRAYVRGKIGLLTSSDDHVDGDEAARCQQVAGRYFELAERYGEGL